MDEGEWKCVATSPENMKQFSTCYVAMSSKQQYELTKYERSNENLMDDTQ